MAHRTWIGMDVHKVDIQVAVLIGRRKTPVEFTVPNTPEGRRKLLRQVREAAPGRIAACYEAGPCGYVLQREFAAAGVACEVIAPALVPRKPGDRVKTDRRDARKLAELLRADLLTPVTPPTATEEAVRDLVRAREDLQGDRTRARHRLSKFLLRHGREYDGTAWTQRHHHWLRQQTFAEPAAQATFADYCLALEQLGARLEALDAELATLAEAAPYAPAVGALRCFRGIDTLTAITLVAELYQAARFSTPRALMAYVGLVPSEHSSGGNERRGGITKAGNRHVRRVLVSAAWKCHGPPRVSATLRRRRQGQPRWAVALADRAQHRLSQRSRRLLHRGKAPSKVAVATARELVGFVWAALTEAEAVAKAA